MQASNLYAVPFFVTPYIGGLLSRPVVERNMRWYDSLKHPQFSPPKWVFGPVWAALYGSMGAASYLVWRDSATPEQALAPLAVYGSHLLLNWSWTTVFFGRHNMKLVS